MPTLQAGDIAVHRIPESERPDFDAAQFFPSIKLTTSACASHFPSPSFGRVVRDGDALWFRYEKA